MAFMVTAFREVISRVLAPVALVAATVLFFAGNAYAAQPLPWQLGLQPPAGSIAEMADDLHNLLLVVITLISLFVLGAAGLCRRAVPRLGQSGAVKDIAQHRDRDSVDRHPRADPCRHRGAVLPASLLSGQDS